MRNFEDLKTMGRRTTLVALATVMVGGRWWSQAKAQEAPPADESFGQKIDRGLDTLGRELRHGWAEVRASIDRMGVQGRVYGRLHWDKDLADATIDIEVREDKSVVLKGSVPSVSARSKAVQLAQDTTGVLEVVDELGIAAQSRTSQHGLWGRSGQLVAMAAAVRSGTSYFGTYLNVCPELQLCRLVTNDPLARSVVGTLVAERQQPVKMTSVREAVLRHVTAALGCDRFHLYSGHPLWAEAQEIACESATRVG